MGTVIQAITLLSNFLSPVFGDYTSLYFYSALFQGNAALIALTAMYLIYKRQNIDTSFDRKVNAVIDFISKISGKVFLYENIFIFEVYDEALVKDFQQHQKNKLQETMGQDAWKKIFLELRSLEKAKDTLWRDARSSVLPVFIILAASILFLPLSNGIHKFPLLEPSFFLIFIVFEILALFFLYKFIRFNSQ